MKILFINTAEKSSEISFFSGKKTYFYKSFSGNKKQSEKLLPYLKNSFNKINTPFSAIEGVIVIEGPGSFTSLRVGITVGNTIAYVLKIPVYSIKTDKYRELSEKYNVNKSNKHLKFHNIFPENVLKKFKNIEIAAPFYNKEPNITLKP